MNHRELWRLLNPDVYEDNSLFDQFDDADEPGGWEDIVKEEMFREAVRRRTARKFDLLDHERDIYYA